MVVPSGVAPDSDRVRAHRRRRNGPCPSIRRGGHPCSPLPYAQDSVRPTGVRRHRRTAPQRANRHRVTDPTTNTHRNDTTASSTRRARLGATSPMRRCSTDRLAI